MSNNLSPTLPVAMQPTAPTQSALRPSPLQQNDLRTLTPPQKAALIIAALGPEAAGPIIERIGDNHLRAFTRAFAHLQMVPQSALRQVIGEFVSQLTDENDDIKGGFDETRELLSQFKSTDDIIRLMDDINVPGGESVWEKLERTSDDLLGEYLSKQRPQLVAVVLSRINTEKASSVLDQLDSDMAGKVILRLSKPLRVNREALKTLTDTIERDFLSPMRKASKTRNPGEMIGAMMNNIMSEKREELLSFIASTAPDILKDVKKSMLTFTDVATRVPPNAIPMAIKEVELDDFLQALKFGRQNAPSSVDFIMSNISQRMAKQYEEQMEDLKAITVQEAEAAQSSYMSVIRKLAASGEIELIEEIVEEDDGDE